MIGRLGTETPRKKGLWKWVCRREKVATIGLGPLLNLMGCKKEICGGIWYCARVSTSPRLMEKKKREREREKLEENLGIGLIEKEGGLGVLFIEWGG